MQSSSAEPPSSVQLLCVGELGIDESRESYGRCPDGWIIVPGVRYCAKIK
jgi:hypothetical protein